MTFLFYFLLVYLLLRYTSRFWGPVLMRTVTKRVMRQAYTRQGGNPFGPQGNPFGAGPQSAPGPQPDTTEHVDPAQPHHRRNKDDGEYVDFEEVK